MCVCVCVFLLYRCRGLILLETYTSNRADDFELPPFLDISREVTGDLDYSMYNLSKKHEQPPSIPSTPTKDRLDAAGVEYDASSKLEASSKVDMEADGHGNSLSSSLVQDRLMNRPEMHAKEKELSPNHLSSDALVHDLVEVKPSETVFKPMTLSELNAKVVVDSSMKNGCHCDIGRDQMASLTLSKLDAAHGSTVRNGSLSENGHIIFDDYERFAKLCLGGKSGAAAVK